MRAPAQSPETGLQTQCDCAAGEPRSTRLVPVPARVRRTFRGNRLAWRLLDSSRSAADAACAGSRACNGDGWRRWPAFTPPGYSRCRRWKTASRLARPSPSWSSACSRQPALPRLHCRTTRPFVPPTARCVRRTTTRGRPPPRHPGPALPLPALQRLRPPLPPLRRSHRRRPLPRPVCPPQDH